MTVTELRPRFGIGGADVAAIVGISPYGSPWSKWAEMTGLVEREPETERMAIGTELEGAIARLFTRRTGLHVAGEQMELRHPRVAWARGHADGLVFDGPNQDINLALGGFEAKTDGRFGWPDGVPAHYQAQAQWYMLLSGLPRWWFAVLHANFRFEVYELEADRSEQRFIAYEAARFWHRHVLGGVAPAVDDSPATADALAAAYPTENPGSRVEVNGADVVAWDCAVRDHARAKRELDRCKAQLIAQLGEAEVGCLDGRAVVSYRTQHRKEFTVAASSFRVLRPASKKESAVRWEQT